MMMRQIMRLSWGGPTCRKRRGPPRGGCRMHFTISDLAPDGYHRGVPGCAGRTHLAETVVE